MVVTKTYQGSPCKKAGHTERYVKGGECVVCGKANGKKYYADNTEKVKAAARKWQAENPKKHIAGVKKWRVERPEAYKKSKKKYQLVNLNKCRYWASLRKKKIKQQTPPWAVGCEIVKEKYLTCPKGYDVDHIHPISKGGLHVHYNLQHLTGYDNRVKGAKIL